MFARQHKLHNLTAIVDYNQVQCINNSCDVLDLNSLQAKWEAFGWGVLETDGHNHYRLDATIQRVPMNRPRCVIAHTVKGKGVSWMEGCVEWHFKSPSGEELEKALEELG